MTFERQIANFIEEQRAAVRGLDAPDLALVRAGEGTALVAEQIGLHEMIRKRAAIDGDERPIASNRALVDSHRGQFLARAGFARYQYRRLAVRDLADRAKQFVHRRARAHDFIARGGNIRHAVECDHAVLMADDLHCPVEVVRNRDIAREVSTQQRARHVVLQLRREQNANPANPSRTKARREAGEIVGREAACEIEHAHRGVTRPEIRPRLAGILQDRNVPTSLPEHVAQTTFW